MNKNISRYFIAAGAVLLIAALSLVVYNQLEAAQAVKSANAALEQLEKIIPDEYEDVDDSFSHSEKPVENDGHSEMEQSEEPEAVELDGEWYIGILYIPSIDLELPVLRDWSYPNLDIACCRYGGTLSGGDMLIAAHNYTGFFKRLDELKSGDQIIFRQLNGVSHVYDVSYTEVVDGYDNEHLLGGSDSWDLTLFTCTWSGRSRVAVRCEVAYRGMDP